MTTAGAAGGRSPRGLLLTTLIGLAWLVTLISLLSMDLTRLPSWLILVALLLRTELQTGLFIAGHDGMHRLLLPARPLWNDRLAAIALALYAALPYRACRRNHQLHHRRAANAGDPDGPPDRRSGPVRWYVHFMAGYLTPAQMGWLLSGWALLALAFRPINSTAPLNVLLFCTLPLLLSSCQLFVFGTYLPHRGQWANPGQHHADSLDLPPWLSLLTCFHFGYHREHHDHPDLAWFELPAARQRFRRSTAAGNAR